MVSVDRNAKYIYTIRNIGEDDNEHAELYVNGNCYDFSNNRYWEALYELNIHEIELQHLKNCFAGIDKAANIVKTTNGYEYDVIYPSTQYHYVVTSNGNYFTNVSSNYTTDGMLDATLSNEIDKISAPTDFIYYSDNYISVYNQYTLERMVILYGSATSLDHFLGGLNSQYFLYENEMFGNIYVDMNCTTLLSDEYIKSHQGERINLFTCVVNKEDIVNSLTINIDLYSKYISDGYEKESYIKSMKVSVTDLEYLSSLGSSQGWFEYGYLHGDGYVEFYDPLNVISKDGYLYQNMDELLSQFNTFISDDYTVKAFINGEGYETCYITIDGYSSFYHNANFDPTTWNLKHNGMIVDKYYYDSNLTNEITFGEYLGKETTIYCSWVKGEIISITIYENDDYQHTYEVKSNVNIYDLSEGYWWENYPLFYDKEFREYVPANAEIIDGSTYYINTKIELVTFYLNKNGQTYEVYGHPYLPVSVNGELYGKSTTNYRAVERNIPYGSMVVYPDDLILEGKTYDVTVKEKIVYKYYIYIGTQIVSEGTLSEKDYNNLSYEVHGYDKLSDKGDTLFDTYLTLDLNTKVPYNLTSMPTEDLILYVVGDFVHITIIDEYNNEYSYNFTTDYTVGEMKSIARHVFDTAKNKYELQYNGVVVNDTDLLKDGVYRMVSLPTPIVIFDDTSITFMLNPSSEELTNGIYLPGPNGEYLLYYLYKDAYFNIRLTAKHLKGKELVVYRKLADE